MTGIGTYGNVDIIGQALGAARKRDKTSVENAAFEGLLNVSDFTAIPDRWTSAKLYTIDTDTSEGYRVDRDALMRVKEQLAAEGVDANSRTPTHEITDEQMEWLSSRHDLDFLSVCSFTHPDYGNFMLDLAYLNVFSLDEVEHMYGVMPFNSGNSAFLYKMDTGGGVSGYVNTDGSLTEDYKELYTRLIMEYLRVKCTGRSESEYEQMAKDLEAQRVERMMIIEDFFARASAVNETPDMSAAVPNIENAADRLKEDFGGLL
ncbi:MAG: hypothetical protein K2N38_04390 [Oscillospiraceae bacterium]|nr:hypothetical protein [Oscillospiraceae bacterium]